VEASEQVVVITGGGRGIGLGLAHHLAHAGAALVINDAGVELDGAADVADLAQRVAADIRQGGGRAIGSDRSIAEPATGEALVHLALQEFGRLDAWVNAAAIARDRMLFNMTDEAWSDVVATNLGGTFYCMRAALKHFKQARAGRLLNLVSTAGLIGNIGQANYAASKAGIFGLTRVAALEMARYGVSVNCVAPFACTRMTESIKGATPEQQAYLERARRATVMQIIPFLAYLISPRAAEISGQLFGARGHEIFVFSQPRPVSTVGHPGGWTPDALERAVGTTLRPCFTPLQTDLDLFAYEPLV
jgi:NAD(P)-dependent dehydrogenase (short-subunit alcohol dehydrogenase family)